MGLRPTIRASLIKLPSNGKKACDDNVARACHNLGFLYEDAKGVEQDYSKATELYKKACDGDIAEACHNLGALYALGKGVRQDYHLAKKYVFKACTLGFQDGCDYLNKMIDSNATDDNDEKIEIILKTMSKTINHLKQID